MIYPSIVDHLVFRVTRLDRTERFYSALLGLPAHRTEDSIMYIVGHTRLFFTTPVEQQLRLHDKEGVGLNHIAFGVRTLDELQSIRTQLDASGVIHSGIILDHYSLTEFIWLDDPDGIRVEFYLRAE